MSVFYSRKYLPIKNRFYCVTSKEQQKLARKFPEYEVELYLLELAKYLSRNPDIKPTSSTKAKNLIQAWFSGASATR
jgi:hypothetical protein